MGSSAADKFYYIMDYSGNYYREDSTKQLVVAGNETEATVFSFADADRRIGAGKKSKFYFMTPASEEEDNQNIPAEVSESGSVAGTIIPAARKLTEAEIPEEIEKSVSEYDLSKIDWKEYLTHFTFIVAGLKGYREELTKAESDADQKICDVLHYIELCDTGVDEARDLVELLKVCREKRRLIKDEEIRVDSFQRTLGTSANVVKAKEALKTIRGLENRRYIPRKFAELFEGSEIKQCPVKLRSVECWFTESTADKEFGSYAEEETQMEFTRKGTIFDEKENDWMAFAVQQAEFYRNADQYIINLQLDIEEIDSVIADTMEEIETSNYNVAQGYKVFKHLKELRLARKQKEKELECLHILTDHFDVGAMADKCESNVDALERFLYEKTV